MSHVGGLVVQGWMTHAWRDRQLRLTDLEKEGQSGCHSGHLGWGTVVGRAWLWFAVVSGL